MPLNPNDFPDQGSGATLDAGSFPDQPAQVPQNSTVSPQPINAGLPDVGSPEETALRQRMQSRVPLTPAQEAGPDTSTFGGSLAERLAQNVEGLVPRTLGAAAQMATPLTGGIEGISDAARRIRDVLSGQPLQQEGKTYDQFTPADWGTFAGDIGTQAATALPIALGLRGIGGAADAIRRSTEAPAQPEAEPVEPIQDTVRLYHATPNIFTNFDPSRATPTGLGGKAHFFEENPGENPETRAYGANLIPVDVPRSKIANLKELQNDPELNQGGNIDAMLQARGYEGFHNPDTGEYGLYSPDKFRTGDSKTGSPAPPLEPVPDVQGTESMARFAPEPDPFEQLQEQMRQRAEQFGVSPEGIITTPEGTQYAIRQPETGEVLQRQPEEAGGAGGERGGVEPSQQGTQTTTAVAGGEDLRTAAEAGEGQIGVAERYAEEDQPGSVIPGEGKDWQTALQQGRDYINNGGDPRLPIRRAKAKGIVGAVDVGIVRAEYERLATEKRAASEVADAAPDDPVAQQNLVDAEEAQRSWRKELQPVLTKASDALRAAQGESPADLSTFSGLHDLVADVYGGDRALTPKERTDLKNHANGVREATGEAADAGARVADEVIRTQRGKKIMSIDELKSDLAGALKDQFKDCLV